MKIAYKNPRAARFAILLALVSALAAVTLAGPDANGCDHDYPQCPDDVATGSPDPNDCPTSSQDPIGGPIDFILMTCEGHSSNCGSEPSSTCNTLKYRTTVAETVDCGVIYFCVSQGAGVGSPTDTGRRCSDFSACSGVTNPAPLPSPIYPPYPPSNPILFP